MKYSKNKVKEAAALKYEHGNGVPTVIAKGRGSIAENIAKMAKENNIPVHENPELAHALNILNIGDDIPPELYEVVAQILVYVCELDKMKGEQIYDK